MHPSKITLDFIPINRIHRNDDIGIVFLEKVRGYDFVASACQELTVFEWIDVDHILDLVAYTHGRQKGNRLRSGAPDNRFLTTVLYLCQRFLPTFCAFREGLLKLLHL